MKPVIQLKTTVIVFVIGLVCFGFSPAMRAVTPAPDGGYTGWNTAEGQDALFSRTTGSLNTAIGAHALFADTDGTSNTAVGAFTLAANSGGYQNVAVGQGALRNNTFGYANTATGFQALYNNTGDVFFDDGNHNTATGYKALYRNGSSDNTAIGYQALYSNTGGGVNTATGSQALYSNSDGSYNTAIGTDALIGNTIGNTNTAIGFQALFHNINGGGNTATGFGALSANSTGINNTAYGSVALSFNTGSDNTALGVNAGSNLTTGSGNVCIGSGVLGVAGESNTTRIRNIYSSVAAGRAVYVNSSNKIGTLSSSRRYKEDIKPIDKASETLFRLKPVTFRYKKEVDPASALSFGLIAEDVAEISPELVTRDEKGNPETVRYEAINAMLLNEFLKEHRKNEEQQAIIMQLKSTDAKQEAIIAQQQKQIDALTAGLQKVSAQFELSKTAPQTVLNIH
jgi:trimeric autotransporter adhesin